MTLLISGLVLFFGIHSISIIDDEWRNRMVVRLGLMTWQGLYSLPAILGLVLIIVGYGQARDETEWLYSTPQWMTWPALVLLVPVFPLLLATYLPGRIQSSVRNPMLVAVVLWALAHLLINGSLADVLLFGAFLLWALLDLASLKWRSSHPVPGPPSNPLNDVIAVVVGLGLYIAFIYGIHQWLIGVPVSFPAA